MQVNKGVYLETLEDIKKFVNFVAGSKGKHPVILKACEEVGIELEDMYPKRFEEIEDKSAGKEVNEMRFSHLDARRKAKINIICEYLFEHKKFKSRQVESYKKITLTPQVRGYSTSDLTATGQENSNTHREKAIKSKIVNQLLVEENLKKLKIEEEAQKLLIEQKIKDKESREASKSLNKRIFQIRDQRIKERLLKRQKDLDLHEQQALKMFQNAQITLKSHSSTFTPTYKYVETESDSEIQEKLQNIHTKLNNSAVRAKKLLLQKVNSNHSVTTQLARKKMIRDQIINKEAEEYSQKILKIQQEIEYSNRRRIEKLNEQKRLSKSVVHTLEKKILDDSIRDEKMRKQEENKEILIERVRKEGKEAMELRTSFIGMKRKLRKKDQEENLKRIQTQKNKERTKWLEKMKDGEGVKGKEVINVEKIRALAKKEVKSRLNGILE